MQPPLATASRPDRRWNLIVGLFVAIVVVALGGFIYWFYIVDQGLSQSELEGLWEVKEVSERGDTEKVDGRGMEITRTKIFTGRLPPGAAEKKLIERREMGSYVVDAKKKTIDLTPVRGEKPEMVLGIYTLAGQELMLCFPNDAKQSRPAQIDKGKDFFVIVATRISKP